VGQQLRIDSDRAYEAAIRLSELTGESVADAVTVALEQRLERERKARERETRIAKVRELAREVHAAMEPGTTSDHSWLYDENGLPK